jgi:diacylglycerol kinase family enzyme
MPGIGIVVNPKGKKYQKDPDKIGRLSFIVGDRGSYQATADIPDLRRVAEQFKSRDIDILAIGGGDGTTHVTLTHFIDVYGEKPLPKITFLRGGTMNTLANSCNIKGVPEKILSNLIYKYHEGEEFESTEVDMMEINGMYGFIFGCGGIYRFMEAYYSGTTPSPAKAAYTLSRAITSALMNGKFARKMFKRFDGDVWVDGEKWPFANWAALYAGSIPLLGLKFKVFHYATEPQRFHAAGFSLPPRHVLKFAPRMFTGKKIDDENLVESPAREMRIELAEPMAFTIDGDMLPAASQITVKSGPRLKVLVR